MRSEIYRDELPWLLRLIGCWGWQRPSLRFNWGEVSFGWGFALGYSIYHDNAHLHAHIGPVAVYLKMPVFITFRPGTEDWNARYGFSVFARSMHLNWRDRYTVVNFPWDWVFVRRTFLRPDGSVFSHEEKGPTRLGTQFDWDAHKRRLLEISETHDYHYLMLPSGEVQSRKATIYGEEMEWRMRWLKALPWPRKVSRTIEVSFDDEVGERSGSWKGGCVGCGYEWRDGETMLQSLRRMERERRFR